MRLAASRIQSSAGGQGQAALTAWMRFTVPAFRRSVSMTWNPFFPLTCRVSFFPGHGTGATFGDRCLRQAGTPDADQPLVATCDSARCPQATHHPCHREIWAEAVTQHEEFSPCCPARRPRKPAWKRSSPAPAAEPGGQQWDD
jgi:hypothetical protein